MLRGNKKKVGKCSHLFLERVARQLSPSKATNMLPPAGPLPKRAAHEACLVPKQSHYYVGAWSPPGDRNLTTPGSRLN